MSRRQLFRGTRMFLPLAAFLGIVVLPACQKQPAPVESPPTPPPVIAPAVALDPNPEPAPMPAAPRDNPVAADALPSLPELLKEYLALGLPLPPEKTKLVKYSQDSTVIINDVVQPKHYWLAFEIKPGAKFEEALLFVGMGQQSVQIFHSHEVKPDSTAVEGTTLPDNYALVLAIQCHARGWDELAKSLLKRSLAAKAQRPIQKRLAFVARNYWVSHLDDPTADRAPVAKRLKELIERNPEFDNEEHRALLASLELALVPSKAKPGSVEALIDALVDYSWESGEVYWRIVELGFDAIPALIEHLNDNRLTRTSYIVGGRIDPGALTPYMRVGNVVRDLLAGLSGERRELIHWKINENWLGRYHDYWTTKIAALKWFEKAQKIGEEAYLLDRAQSRVDGYAIQVIATKYPRHLPGIYRMVLEKYPKDHSTFLAKALVGRQSSIDG